MSMRPKLFVCLVLSLALLGALERGQAQGFKWWQNERFQEELGLTTEQTGRLEEIFQIPAAHPEDAEGHARQARGAAVEGHQRSACRRGQGAGGRSSASRRRAAN